MASSLIQLSSASYPPNPTLRYPCASEHLLTLKHKYWLNCTKIPDFILDFLHICEVLFDYQIPFVEFNITKYSGRSQTLLYPIKWVFTQETQTCVVKMFLKYYNWTMNECDSDSYTNNSVVLLLSIKM